MQKPSLFLGIDDAGRGPVLGPMVLSGILIEKKDKPFLKKLGIKDSKLLTPEKRGEIKKQIKKFPHHTEITHPKEINKLMETGTNLNKIEAIKSAKIINKLTKEIKEKIKITIDCPSVNTISWKNTLLSYVKNKNLEISCEHKADANHIEVSAASIIAKITRDNEIKNFSKKLKIKIGSGYPSDPYTKSCLEKNHKLLKKHDFIRTSWETYKTLIARKQQQQLF